MGGVSHFLAPLPSRGTAPHNPAMFRLVKTGCQCNARDDEELDTRLHLVLKDCEAIQVSRGRLRTVQWLLISGADWHAHNWKGRTPVSMAMQIKGSDVACVFKKGSRIAVFEASFQGR